MNLVKKEKNGKLSVLPKGAELVICKLCNSYVVASKIAIHNRYERLSHIETSVNSSL